MAEGDVRWGRGGFSMVSSSERGMPLYGVMKSWYDKRKRKADLIGLIRGLDAAPESAKTVAVILF